MTLLCKREADDLCAQPLLLQGLALPSSPRVSVVHLWTLLGVPWDPRAELPRTQRPGAQGTCRPFSPIAALMALCPAVTGDELALIHSKVVCLQPLPIHAGSRLPQEHCRIGDLTQACRKGGVSLSETGQGNGGSRLTAPHPASGACGGLRRWGEQEVSGESGDLKSARLCGLGKSHLADPPFPHLHVEEKPTSSLHTWTSWEVHMGRCRAGAGRIARPTQSVFFSPKERHRNGRPGRCSDSKMLSWTHVTQRHQT